MRLRGGRIALAILVAAVSLSLVVPLPPGSPGHSGIPTAPRPSVAETHPPPSEAHAAAGGPTLGVLDEIPVRGGPVAGVVDPVTGTLFALGGSSSNATRIDNETIDGSVGVGQFPASGVYDPANGDVYIMNGDSYNVTVIHGNRTVGNVTVGTFPTSIVYDTVDEEVYVANYGGTNVSIINGTASAGSVTVATGYNDPYALAYDAALGEVFVLVTDAQCSVVLLRGSAEVGSIALPGNTNPAAIAYDPADGYVYVAGTGSGNVSVLNATGVVGNISIPGSPTHLTYDPVAGDMLLLLGTANSSAGEIEVLNGTAAVAEFLVPYVPVGGAFDGAAGVAVLFGGFSSPGFLVVDASGVVATIAAPAGVSSEAYDPVYRCIYAFNTMTNNVSVVGSGTFYNLTFTEAGVPNGTYWAVTVGGVQQTSDRTSLAFALVNGTYPYTIGSVVYQNVTPNGTRSGASNVTVSGLPSAGVVTIDGANLAEPTVVFHLAIAVVFEATGLPNGTAWTVTFNGTLRSASSPTITFVAPVGSFAYSIGGEAGFEVGSIPPSGTIAVAESDAPTLTVVVAFAPVTYQVQISESGLPAGSVFEATVDGALASITVSPTSETLAWSGLSNGSYPYEIVTVPGWHQSTLPRAATLTVAGGDQPTDGSGVGFDATLQFSPTLYEVSFSTLGLPASTSWTLSVGGSPHSYTAASVTLALANGTYDYTLTDLSGWHESTAPYYGRFTVDGANMTMTPFYFVRVTYALTFVERGLPSNAFWSIVAGGQYLNGTGVTITFATPNGTIAYSVAPVPGYSPMVGSGAVQVNGTDLLVDVVFSENAAAVAPAWLLPAGAGAVGGGLAVAAALALLQPLRRRPAGPPRVDDRPANPDEPAPSRSP